jgi:hypothetical protein
MKTPEDEHRLYLAEWREHSQIDADPGSRRSEPGPLGTCLSQVSKPRLPNKRRTFIFILAVSRRQSARRSIKTLRHVQSKRSVMFDRDLNAATFWRLLVGDQAGRDARRRRRHWGKGVTSMAV